MKKLTFIIILLTLSCQYLKAEDFFQQYSGTFKFPKGSILTEVNIITENGALQINSAIGKTVLEKTAAADIFNIPSYNGTVSFKRNELKKITGIKIEVMNTILEGNKTEKKGSTIQESVLPINKASFPIKYLPSMMIMENPELPTSFPNLF